MFSDHFQSKYLSCAGNFYFVNRPLHDVHDVHPKLCRCDNAQHTQSDVQPLTGGSFKIIEHYYSENSDYSVPLVSGYNPS